MTFKEPTDFRFLESALAPAAEKPASLSQKLKTSASISRQEPSKPGFSYTRVWGGKEERLLIPLHLKNIKGTGENPRSSTLRLNNEPLIILPFWFRAHTQVKYACCVVM